MKQIRGFVFILFAMMIVNDLAAQSYQLYNSDVYNYNHYVNKSELLICDSLFSEAIQYYDSAFTYVDYPISIDKYNAALCALITGQFKKGIKDLSYIVKRGYDYSQLMDNSVIKNLTNYKRSVLFHKLKNTPIEIDQRLKSKYDSLLVIDQYFRHDTLYWIKNRDTLDKTNYSCGLAVSQLIDTYGFPSESLVGVPIDLNSAMPWEIIAVHNHVRPNTPFRVDFCPVIIDAYEKGLISSSKAAFHIKECTGNDLFGVASIGLVKVCYKNGDSVTCRQGYINLPVKSMNRIDAHRKSFGLETIDEERIKINFNQKHPDFHLSDLQSTTFDTSNENDYNSFKDNLIEIE